MILADKIIEERKRLGLTQEELAEKLSVSRQAVSKWESAQSIPDLQKIITMSELFSVSTDYLLKDDAKPEEKPVEELDSDRNIRRVSMEEANEYLSFMKQQSKRIALGVLMCILSPVTLVLLAGFSEEGILGITEKLAATIGLAVLFLLVAPAVFLFIQSGTKAERFKYLNNESFETSYGVTGFVKEQMKEDSEKFSRSIALGVIMCILSPLPIVISSLVTERGVIVVAMVSVLLCIVAASVYIIIETSIVKNSYKTLLQEGEYKPEEKKHNDMVSTLNGIYWTLAAAGFLTWSFISNAWDKTWILWPIAGVLFVPFVKIVGYISRNSEK